jgi:lipopolysaccharide export LptBFGC system permease protein LptF
MPRLLSRYIAAELLKTMVLNTTVLVAVIAFGAALKPLAQNLIGGGDLLKYVLVASVPMLQYALPFAAGFAATLVIHRMVSDNELLAMSASGLSYGTIMRPIFAIGAALLVFMLILVNYLVPFFWTQMESLLARDVTRLLASSIERGEAFNIGDTQIFADQVLVIDDPAGTDAESRLVLVGVAALETDELHRVVTEFTAEYATLDVHRVDGRAIIKMALGDSTIYREQDGALVRVPNAEPQAMNLGRGFTRKPKSFTLSELLSHRRVNEHYPAVADERERTFKAIAKAQAWLCAADSIARGEPLLLDDERRGLSYAVSAGTLHGSTLEGGVDVLERKAGSTIRHATGETAALRLVTWAPGESPHFDLVFEPSRVEDLAEPDAPARHWPARLAMLGAAGCTEGVDTSLDNDALFATVAALELPSSVFWSALKEEITDAAMGVDQARIGLLWDIDARIQQRIAQSLLAPLLLVLGAALAVSFKAATPLTIYVLAFLPSIAAILLISTGEQGLRSDPALGSEIMLWSGTVLLVGAIAIVWIRMRRN